MCEIDPSGKIANGTITESIKVDDINENNGNISSYLDLSAVRVVFDTNENKLYVGQELMGIIPNQTKNLQYWALIDTDNNTSTGADENVLETLGAPLSDSSGSDLAIKTQVKGNNITGHIWKYENENRSMIPIPSSAFKADL